MDMALFNNRLKSEAERFWKSIVDFLVWSGSTIENIWNKWKEKDFAKAINIRKIKKMISVRGFWDFWEIKGKKGRREKEGGEVQMWLESESS